MNRRLTWLLVALLLILFAAHEIPRFYESQGELRAALDIGSGATNLKIAKVDPKTNKIISQIFDKSIPVPYQKHLEQSSDNTFDREVMEQGLQAIKELKQTAENYHVKKVIGVATAAFRQAVNAPQFAKEIEQQTGVQVRIINQDEEGILAFRGALALTPAEPEKTVVWDIGGGSMQLTTLTEAGTYLVEKGKTASIPFKNAIIEQIQHKNLSVVQSPNPMSPEEIQAALHYAGNLALQTDPYVVTKIQTPGTQVLAAGSLFNYGILPLVSDKKIASAAELEQAVLKMANKTDAELPGGSLVEVAVSNPVLVLGYMNALQIPQVEVVKVNNADGALTYRPYWE
jgi:exopolyphosphatase/guanosine-5'-triphosphate,3'-diphosphate pyrophosphatase